MEILTVSLKIIGGTFRKSWNEQLLVVVSLGKLRYLGMTF